MQAFYRDLEKQAGPDEGPCRVVIVGPFESADAWRSAAESLQLYTLTATAPDEADLAISGDSATIAVAPLSVFKDKAYLEAACRWLSRTAVVVVTDSESDAALWRVLAWDALTADQAASGAVAVLSQARAEARLRAKKRCLVSSYYSRLASLSSDEREVLGAVCEGKLNKQIAGDYRVSIRTIEQRRRRVFEKMGVDSAVPLAALTATVKILSEQVRYTHRSATPSMHLPRKNAVMTLAAPLTQTATGYLAVG